MLLIESKKLQQAVINSGLMVAEVQRAAGLSKAATYRLVNHGGHARLSTIGKIARVLSVDVSAITKEV